MKVKIKTHVAVKRPTLASLKKPASLAYHYRLPFGCNTLPFNFRARPQGIVTKAFFIVILMLSSTIVIGCSRMASFIPNRNASESETQTREVVEGDESPSNSPQRPEERPVDRGEGLPTFLAGAIQGEVLTDETGIIRVKIYGHRAISAPHLLESAWTVRADRMSGLDASEGSFLTSRREANVLASAPVNAEGSFSLEFVKVNAVEEIGLTLIRTVGRSNDSFDNPMPGVVATINNESHFYFKKAESEPSVPPNPQPTATSTMLALSPSFPAPTFTSEVRNTIVPTSEVATASRTSTMIAAPTNVPTSSITPTWNVPPPSATSMPSLYPELTATIPTSSACLEPSKSHEMLSPLSNKGR